MDFPADTLGHLRSLGMGLTAYCDARDCRHSAKVLEALIAKHGPDAVYLADPKTRRSPFKLICRKCQSREVSIMVTSNPEIGQRASRG